jgi:hypothetical protein
MGVKVLLGARVALASMVCSDGVSVATFAVARTFAVDFGVLDAG